MTRSQQARAVLVLCALAGIAYLPAQKLPFIADDYVQVQLGRDYGPVASWPALLRDPLYRCRATSVILTYWTERLWGLNPVAFNLSSLVLHAVNTLLIFVLGVWWAVGWKRSFAAAGFFAVAQGHQEAVIWYAAIPELLVFLFSAVTFLTFLCSLRAGHRRWLWYLASLGSFVFALSSKESGVAVVGGLLLACIVERVPARRTVRLLLPFGLLACAYVYAIFASSSAILHFHDGAFSLHAPVGWTLLNSAARILWFWGVLALAFLYGWDRKAMWTVVPACLIWMFIALTPYGFLTYMNRVPSRHTYLASAGLSLLIGAAFVALQGSRRRAWVPVLAAVVLAYDITYLWTKKQAQYERRAEPTEQLVRAYKGNPGQVRIQCFPYSQWIARYAVEIGAGKSWDDRIWQLRKGCLPEETAITIEE